MIQRVLAALPQFGYRFNDEYQLQDGLAKVLESFRIPFEREVSLSPKDRLDFLCGGTLAIEVKVDGSYAAALRQVDRYLAHETVHAAVIVTSRFWAAQSGSIVETLHGKPVAMLRVGRVVF